MGIDAVILKGEGYLTSLEAKPVNLVGLSVLHHLLARRNPSEICAVS